MRARRLTTGTVRDSAGILRSRALTFLLVCVLGIGLAAAAHSAQTHKHATHRVAVFAVSGADMSHSAPRTDVHGSPVAAPRSGPATQGHPGTSDSSSDVSAHTVQAPQVRGPPGQALA